MMNKRAVVKTGHVHIVGYHAALRECKIKPQDAMPTSHISWTDLRMRSGPPVTWERGAQNRHWTGLPWSNVVGKQVSYIGIKNLRRVYICLRNNPPSRNPSRVIIIIIIIVFIVIVIILLLFIHYY